MPATTSPAWDARSAALWAALDSHTPEDFRAKIAVLAAELPAGHPAALFERACAHDSTGESDRAVPLYAQALAAGLGGIKRRRAVIQMASSLRNLGRAPESVALLEAERTQPSDELDDALVATLALALVDTGRAREAAALAIEALARHLPRYNRSMANYARALVAAPKEALDLVAFWQDAGPGAWFKKDDAFDARFSDRFAALHDAAARGELATWSATPEGALALVLLLDQYPRNAFRGTPRMYATDPRARDVAHAALAAGHDRAVPEALQTFFYLPFGHAENIADQERAVELTRHLGGKSLEYAQGHRDIIARFARFPHRNAVLGRPTTPEEQKFIDEGGFAG